MSQDALDELKFNEQGLIPAVTQDADTGEVLMVAWMNAESLKSTLETGKTHFWSRSRRKFWMKGESSGHTQEVVGISTDCDKDTLLIRVRQAGGACHTGYRSCFSWHLDGGRWVERGEKVFDPDDVYRT
jgi:phosphoribosyl-AMP cyclohydrolase